MTGSRRQRPGRQDPSRDRDRPGPRTRRSVLRSAGAVAMLGLTAACARIPVDTPIDSRELGGQAQPGAPYVRALPPPQDATPQQIVSGFVQAGVGPEDDFAVARKYLTSPAREDWDPHAGVTVYSGSQELQITTVSETEVSLVVSAVGTVDGSGVRSLLAGPASREITVELEQVEDQWRISAVPDGIFLSEAAFETLYAPARLYFLDAREDHLVPDHRWISLQRGADGVLSHLAAGPATFLADAVHSAVPVTSGALDARITTGADGGVRVEVPDAVAALDGGARGLALTQIEWSLRSLRTLSGVRLVQDGRDLTPSDDLAIERPLPGHRPIAAGPTGVISLADAGSDPETAQLVPELSDTELSAPALARNGVLAAALTAQESVVLIASTDGSVPLREAATGGDFVAPSVDDAGYVWTSTRSNAGVLLALSASGPEQDAMVDAPWLAGRQVRALDIAADATRMIVQSADAGGSRLDLCAVRRDEDGVPIALTEPSVVRTFLSDVIQASWFDEIAAIVLGDDPASGERRAQVVDFASGRDPLPPLEETVTRIAGTVVADTYWAGSGSGQLLRGDREGWTVVDIPGRDPSFY